MSAANTLWAADFSYLRCWEGLVFFSFVIDAFSRKIVGYIAWLNNDRLHSALGYQSPADHEQLYARRSRTLAGTTTKDGNH